MVKKIRKNVNAEFVIKFMKGMNDSFESIRSRVLTTFPMANINTVFNIAITPEKEQSCGNMLPQVIYTQRIGDAINGNKEVAMPQMNAVRVNFQNSRGRRFADREKHFSVHFAMDQGIPLIDINKSMVIHQIASIQTRIFLIVVLVTIVCVQMLLMVDILLLVVLRQEI